MFNIKVKSQGTLGTTRHKGNTNKLCRKTRRQRARSWCFTWNNHTENDMAQLAQTFLKIGTQKYFYQEEIGEEKTPHLQGVINFKNPIDFNSLKKISDKIHWEACKNLRASIKYCSKEETRNGRQFSHGINNNELWHAPIPLMTHREMLDDMNKQMQNTNKGVAKEWMELEKKLYGTTYKYLD